MDLTITSFPVLNGLAIIDEVYAKIRDLKTTKKMIIYHQILTIMMS